MDSLVSAKQYMPDAATVAEIQAHIAEYNAKRPAILRSGKFWAAIYLVPYAIAAVLLVYQTWGLDQKHRVFLIAVLAAFLIGGLLFSLAWRPVTRHSNSLREALFPKLFAFIDDLHYSHGQAPALLRDLQALKLVQFTSSANDDFISGTHHGLQFDLLETKLTYGSGRSKEVVFDGLIFRFKLDNPFPGRLVAAKRSRLMEAWKEMWRTGPKDDILSGNSRLDETHVFHSDNHAAAQPIIAGPLTSLLIGLGDEWQTSDLRIALSGDCGYLMLPAEGDYFALPSIHEDVGYSRDVEPLVDEMAMLLRVAHRVKGLG